MRWVLHRHLPALSLLPPLCLEDPTGISSLLAILDLHIVIMKWLSISTHREILKKEWGNSAGRCRQSHSRVLTHSGRHVDPMQISGKPSGTAFSQLEGGLSTKPCKCTGTAFMRLEDSGTHSCITDKNTHDHGANNSCPQIYTQIKKQKVGPVLGPYITLLRHFQKHDITWPFPLCSELNPFKTKEDFQGSALLLFLFLMAINSSTKYLFKRQHI